MLFETCKDVCRVSVERFSNVEDRGDNSEDDEKELEEEGEIVR